MVLTRSVKRWSPTSNHDPRSYDAVGRLTNFAHPGGTHKLALCVFQGGTYKLALCVFQGGTYKLALCVVLGIVVLHRQTSLSVPPVYHFMGQRALADFAV